MDALENAPPENIFNRPRIPSEVCACNAPNLAGSKPGNTTNEPTRYIRMNPKVLRILVLRSSIFQMF
jgi:hypothetical protein